jgi:hypothetical protein
MCACRDKACSDKVTEEMTKWGQEQAKDQAKDQQEPVRLSEAETREAAAMGEQMGKCMMRAMGADQPRH